MVCTEVFCDLSDDFVRKSQKVYVWVRYFVLKIPNRNNNILSMV